MRQSTRKLINYYLRAKPKKLLTHLIINQLKYEEEQRQKLTNNGH